MKNLLSEFLSELRCIELFNNTDYYKVYGIVNPINNELFYIGCTKVELYKRIYCHHKERSVFDDSAPVSKNKRIKALISIGVKPEVKVFYYIKDRKTALGVEKCLTHFLINNKLNVKLLNKANSLSINYETIDQ
jgi:hypothetical protein